MQLIVNTESTDTEKMSTINKESLIEKPFINGSQEINNIIKAIDDQEIPIANKENIQIEENKIINIDENGHPERNQEVNDEVKIIVNTKEEVKISVDDATAVDEECKQLTDGTRPDCSDIKNGIENVTCEMDENKSQNNSVDKNQGSKNVDIKYDTEKNAENEIVKGEDKKDDNKIVEEINPVKDVQLDEETDSDSLKDKKNVVNVDVDQEAGVIISEVKESNTKFKKILQESSHDVTAAAPDSMKADEFETIQDKASNESSETILDVGIEFPSACTSDGESASQRLTQISAISEDNVHSIIESESTIISSGDNSDYKEPSVDVADVSDETTTGDNKNTGFVTEILNPSDVTEVVTVENNSATTQQLMEDVEMESTECKINDIADVNAEKKNACTQIAKHVDMVNLEDKNKDDVDCQGTITMDISENVNETMESSKNVELEVKDKNKDGVCSEVTTVPTVGENENKSISTSPKNVSMETAQDEKYSEIQNETKGQTKASTVNDIVDLDEVKIVEDDHKKDLSDKNEISRITQKVEEKIKRTTTIRLSNTLDILSDDDEDSVKTLSPEPPKGDTQNVGSPEVSEKYINLDDDDDVMLIDDVTSSNDKQKTPEVTVGSGILDNAEPDNSKETEGSKVPVTGSDLDPVQPERPPSSEPINKQIVDETTEENVEKSKPLIPDNFFKSFKKNLAEMTRDDLEEFCVLKIVESIIERSNLNDIKSKLKTMTLGLEEYKKKAMMLTKQNRDLQVVLKSIQEELKKKSATAITPLKITRSVGMQVIMPDKNRRKGMGQNTGVSPNTNTQTNVSNNTNRPQRNSNQNQRLQKQANTLQSIPVPRLVPAANTNVTNKPAQSSTTNNAKTATSLPNGAKNAPVTQKPAEKRSHSRAQSVTVDLTDDEPPAKQMQKNSPVPPVRLIPSQNLLSARQQFTQNSPRKVYIPISGPQAQNIRPAQTVMLKNVPSPGPRPNRPPMVRLPQTSVRSSRGPNSNRHPAPLPDAMKQYQPPNWKALPPAPDLKLSKVENGIVISWKIDGYQDDSYEEIASYQLYAYQETSTPPNTALWKKIGDVKALPLPMACTLTQFMAGYKYYFAVRAVDIRSRVGPFSLPGSILLLNKM